MTDSPRPTEPRIDLLVPVVAGAQATDYGRVDLMGTVSGLGDYDDVFAAAEPIDFHGERLMVLGLDGLIRAKEAAGRDKDKLHLATLKALRALKDE